MKHARLLPALLSILLVAGCGSSTTSNDSAPPDPCAGVAELGRPIGNPNVPVKFEDAFCPNAVFIATAKLGWLHGPITSTTFRPSVCPPNARCLAVPFGVEGWVIFTFAFGDPTMIHVGAPETGAAGLVAGEPERVPDWLIDEVQGVSG
jgi:hypothetical protein